MSVKKRYVVLAALRGFALAGIILANFPEFSLWTFADPASHSSLDRIVRAVQYFFIDGKFYCTGHDARKLFVLEFPP